MDFLTSEVFLEGLTVVDVLVGIFATLVLALMGAQIRLINKKVSLLKLSQTQRSGEITDQAARVAATDSDLSMRRHEIDTQEKRIITQEALARELSGIVEDQRKLQSRAMSRMNEAARDLKNAEEDLTARKADLEDMKHWYEQTRLSRIHGRKDLKALIEAK